MIPDSTKITTAEFIKGFDAVGRIATAKTDHYFQVEGGKITQKKAPEGRMQRLFENIKRLFQQLKDNMGFRPQFARELESSLTELYKKAIQVLQDPALTEEQLEAIEVDFNSVQARISKIKRFEFSDDFARVCRDLKNQIESRGLYFIPDESVSSDNQPKPKAKAKAQAQAQEEINIPDEQLQFLGDQVEGGKDEKPVEAEKSPEKVEAGKDEKPVETEKSPEKVEAGKDEKPVETEKPPEKVETGKKGKLSKTGKTDGKRKSGKINKKSTPNTQQTEKRPASPKPTEAPPVRGQWQRRPKV